MRLMDIHPLDHHDPVSGTWCAFEVGQPDQRESKSGSLPLDEEGLALYRVSVLRVLFAMSLEGGMIRHCAWGRAELR